MTYDAEGRLTGINAGGGAQTETYLYDDVGGYAITDGAGNSATEALPGHIIGRVTDASGDVNGLVFNPQGQVTGSESANGASQSFIYDSAGRVTSITDANGATINFGYSGASTQPISPTPTARRGASLTTVRGASQARHGPTERRCRSNTTRTAI